MADNYAPHGLAGSSNYYGTKPGKQLGSPGWDDTRNASLPLPAQRGAGCGGGSMGVHYCGAARIPGWQAPGILPAYVNEGLPWGGSRVTNEDSGGQKEGGTTENPCGPQAATATYTVHPPSGSQKPDPCGDTGGGGGGGKKKRDPMQDAMDAQDPWSFGNVVDTTDDYFNSAEEIGAFAGGAIGAYYGSFLGPIGAIVGGIVGAVAGGILAAKADAATGNHVNNATRSVPGLNTAIGIAGIITPDPGDFARGATKVGRHVAEETAEDGIENAARRGVREAEGNAARNVHDTHGGGSAHGTGSSTTTDAVAANAAQRGLGRRVTEMNPYDEVVHQAGTPRIRRYGKFTPPRTSGDVVGARKVTEYRATPDGIGGYKTDGKIRSWYESYYSNGQPRSVRPLRGAEKTNHYTFDKSGKRVLDDEWLKK